MILFFDTETTGIRKNGFVPRVVQIGALLTDDRGNTISELNVLLQPVGFDTVPFDAANVHGFTIEKIRACGVDRHAGLQTFFGLVEAADTIVAHNIEYDLDLLQIEIEADPQSTGWNALLQGVRQFCTMINSRDTLKMPLSDAQARFFRDTGVDQLYKNPRLVEAYRHFFDREFEGAHDAMADVKACRDVFFELHKLKPAEA